MSNAQYSYIALALLLLVIVAVAWWLWRASRWTPGKIPRHPIVLVHGVMGFDRIGFGPLTQDYFRGVVKALGGTGVRVYAPRLPPLGSVPARAQALADFIRALPHAKVNIIAHSMGGLDARWAVAKLDIADRVACVVTVATPHRGSPLADLAATGRLGTLLSRVAGAEHALAWLTSAAAERINHEAPDHPRVSYGSVVCRSGRRLWLSNPFLYATSRVIGADSDGLVPTTSQSWGSVWLEVEHDHWGQVGWSLWHSPEQLYSEILRELAARGH